MYSLNKKTKDSISKGTGIQSNEFMVLSATQIDKRIELKIRKKLNFLKSDDKRLKARGSVYIFLHRLISLFSIDKKLSKI